MSPSSGPADYITPEGYAALEAEVERLWSRERPKVTREVSAAAADGDRSENAAYIYGKKRLREIDSRIRYLRKKLDRLEIVHVTARDDGRVYFGAWVTLESEDAERLRYRLVGPDEARAEDGLISIGSPLGRALVGREEGDRVTVRRPAGETTVEILAVEYDTLG